MDLAIYLRGFPPVEEPLYPGGDGAPGVQHWHGLTKAVHVQAGALAAQGVRVTVVCEGAEDVALRTEAGYAIRCFARPRPSRLHFDLAPGLRAWVVDTAPELMVLNGIFMPSLFTLARLLRRHGVPYVVAPHDPYHPSLFRTHAVRKHVYWYLCERPMLRRARAIQVLDARHGEWLRRRGVHTPVVALPNAFLTADVVHASANGSAGERRAGPVRLFYLGRLDVHNKGLDLLVEAMAGLGDEVRLVLQGSDDAGGRAALDAQIAARGLGATVALRASDFSTTAPQLIREHDVFCLPSRFEGFGLSALEAMLAERVLVVSEVAGIAPHVAASGCGVVVEPTVDALREGVRALLRRRGDWDAMGRRGRSYALGTLSPEAVGCTARRCYEQMLAG